MKLNSFQGCLLSSMENLSLTDFLKVSNASDVCLSNARSVFERKYTETEFLTPASSLYSSGQMESGYILRLEKL